MLLSDLLANFATPAETLSSPGATSLDNQAQDQRDLETFDKGYRDGWDDAMRATEEDGKRLHADFAQNLQDLSFTYREAYGHILAAMEPLLTQIVESVLPATLQDSLGHHLIDRLQDHARQSGEAQVDIMVSPGELALVEAMADADIGFPLRIIADGTLAPGQADIRFSEDHEERIDLTEIVAEIRDAITGFTHESRRTANG